MTSEPLNQNNVQRHAISRALFGILAVVFLVLVLQINHRISSGHSGDFRHFYFAAGALLDHRDLYGPVPLDVVEHSLRRPARQVEKNWYTIDQDRYLYPPPIAMLYAPIARLRFETAERIAMLVNALLVFAGILLTTSAFVDRFGLRNINWLLGAAALLGTLLNLDKVHLELQMFQTNSLMFFLFALSLHTLDRRPIFAGIPLGLIFNIKYLSLGLLPWLILRRRWGSAISCVISAIVFALLPALVSGWHGNLENLRVAYGGLLHMVGVHGQAEQANVDDIRDYLSCSITSALARTTPRGHSLLLPMLATALISLVSMVIVIAMYRVKKMPPFIFPPAGPQKVQPWRSAIGIEFVSILAATLCFSPQTNTRHLMLVLLITIPLAVLILAGRSRIPAILAALLIGIGFVYPPGGQAPAAHHLAHLWFGIGGQCWCLLTAMFLLVMSGLEQACPSFSDGPITVAPATPPPAA
jgi:hypothetical protein